MKRFYGNFRDKPGKAVIVVGAGPAGVQASLDLADSGFKVYLLEKEDRPGGKMALVGPTFPLNNCDSLWPGLRFREDGKPLIHTCSNPCTCLERRLDDMESCQGIEVLTSAVLENVTGEAGHFTVSISGKDRQERLNVQAILLAPGYDLFDAALAGEYGYSVYANVVSGLDLERLLRIQECFSGDKFLRPSDSVQARRIAFIQCVGSRDCSRGVEYCSSVCCMSSTKEAILVKEYQPETDATIFYLDLRTYGKNFDRYAELAQGLNIRYLRSMISRVREDPVTKNLLIQYVDSMDRVQSEEFDLVVLALAVQPANGLKDLAGRLQVDLNEYGFVATNWDRPYATSREGIFVAGAAVRPVTIAEAVAEGSGAAVEVCRFQAMGRSGADGAGTRVYSGGERSGQTVEHQTQDGRETKAAVFICRCQGSLASEGELQELALATSKIPGVARVEVIDGACQKASRTRIVKLIREENLNKITLGACAGRVEEAGFRRLMVEGGLDPFVLEVAYLRELKAVTAPNRFNSAARSALRGSVSKALTDIPRGEQELPVAERALVIGGGLAGMTAALALAGQGIASCLVEKDASLGGYAAKIKFNLEGGGLAGLITRLATSVNESPLVQVVTSARVERIAGGVGHFTTTVSVGSPEQSHIRRLTTLEHGVVIVATGSEEQPADYRWLEKDQRVMRGSDLEGLLDSGELVLQGKNQIVFVQCQGSRDAKFPNCRRTCCGQTLKNALRLKELNPAIEVYVLYRDLRSYGFMEKYYRQAREKGIVFLRYEAGQLPEPRLSEVGVLELEIAEPGIGSIVLWPDLLVVANGPHPAAGNRDLAERLGITVGDDGFFQENHGKWFPVDATREGIFICGTAHSPMYAAETIRQALGAAGRATGILTKSSLYAGQVVAEVDSEKCAACLTCVRTCPDKVPRIGAGHKAEIDPAQCLGCGICAAECPAKAITIHHYADNQLVAQIHGLLAEV